MTTTRTVLVRCVVRALLLCGAAVGSVRADAVKADRGVGVGRGGEIGAGAGRGRSLPDAAGSSGGRPSALARLAPSPPRRGGAGRPGPLPLTGRGVATERDTRGFPRMWSGREDPNTGVAAILRAPTGDAGVFAAFAAPGARPRVQDDASGDVSRDAQYEGTPNARPDVRRDARPDEQPDAGPDASRMSRSEEVSDLGAPRTSSSESAHRSPLPNDDAIGRPAAGNVTCSDSCDCSAPSMSTRPPTGTLTANPRAPASSAPGGRTGRGCSADDSFRAKRGMLGGGRTLRPVQRALTTNAAPQPQSVDVLITGGRLVDGTGSAPRTTDVGIRGDRVVFVGDAKARGVTGTRMIDARGLVVAPGFMDPHAHVLVDLQQSSTSRLDGYLMQGVTTVLTGNDGGGPVNVGAALSLWTRNGIGPNAGVFIGQGSVRGTVVGRAAVAASRAQVDSMRALVRRAMQQGAMGLSSGLFYAPGSFATTEEVIELAKEVAPFGGVYDTHQRDESSYGIGLLASTREAMRIAKEAGITLNISHIKALGVDVWGRSDSLIAMIRAARARGDKVFADQYPYTASGTSLTASLVPRWAEDGGNAALLARFANDTLLPRLRKEMDDNMRRRGGAASLLLVDPRDRSLLGLTLAQVAERMKTDPISAAIAVIRNGGSGVASFNMQQSDIDLLAKEPWVMTGSDGSDGHPRKYGTFPKKLREYVFDRTVLSLEAMVHQSSALPAQVFGLTDRGEVREGKFADVIVFDPATVRDKSTYIEPTLLAVGMKYVFVNGVAVVDGGAVNKATPGRALKGANAARQ